MEDYNETGTDMEEKDMEEEFEVEMEDYNETGTDMEEKDMEEEFEVEMEDYNETESEIDSKASFAEQLYELSQQNFESSYEYDSKLNEIMDEIERDLFFGKLLKKGVQRLAKMGKKYVQGLPVFQGIKTITNLARGNVTDAIKNIATGALNSFAPGASVGLQALSSLSGESEFPESSENNLEKWKNFVGFAEIAYENLIDNFNETAIKNPIAANNLANQSLQTAKQKSKYRSNFRPHTRTSHSSRKLGSITSRKKRFRIRRGDDIGIKGNNFYIRIKGL
jgi:hypothetical protein